MDIIIAENLHDKSVLSMLSLSLYMPSEERLNHLAGEYEADKNVFVLACIEDGMAVGIIALKRLTCEACEILNIGVSPAFRGRKIGSRLIDTAIECFSCRNLTAETDDDAVGFYRSYGFEIEALGEKYPGFPRYLCTLKS